MTGTADRPSTEYALGKLEGQLREIVHNMNNQSQKLDAIHDKIAKLDTLPGEVAELKTRIVALETERHRRDGAMGLGGALLKSPLVGWIVAAGATLWAIITGKLHT